MSNYANCEFDIGEYRTGDSCAIVEGHDFNIHKTYFGKKKFKKQCRVQHVIPAAVTDPTVAKVTEAVHKAEAAFRKAKAAADSAKLAYEQVKKSRASMRTKRQHLNRSNAATNHFTTHHNFNTAVLGGRRHQQQPLMRTRRNRSAKKVQIKQNINVNKRQIKRQTKGVNRNIISRKVNVQKAQMTQRKQSNHARRNRQNINNHKNFSNRHANNHALTRNNGRTKNIRAQTSSVAPQPNVHSVQHQTPVAVQQNTQQLPQPLVQTIRPQPIVQTIQPNIQQYPIDNSPIPGQNTLSQEPPQIEQTPIPVEQPQLAAVSPVPAARVNTYTPTTPQIINSAH
jgi:hypothetical protein